MPYPLAHYALGLVLLVTVVAFWPSYFGQLSEAPVAFHVHGVSAILWIVLAGFQSWTIHDGRRRLHRSMGLASLGLFPVLIASLVMIANVSAEAHAAGDAYGRQVGAVFVWATAAALVAYLWLFKEALRNRHRVHLHAGYMLATVFFLWEPAASRLLVGFFPPMAIGGPADFHKIPHAIALGSAMAIPVAFYLYLRRDRGRAPLLATIFLLLLQIGGIYTVAGTDLWRAGVEAYAGLPGWVTVGAGFLLGALAAGWGWTGLRTAGVSPQPAPSR